MNMELQSTGGRGGNTKCMKRHTLPPREIAARIRILTSIKARMESEQK